MTHWEVEHLVSDYLEGQLAADQRVAVEQHLAACLACRELVESVQSTIALCRAAEELEPAPRLLSKIVLATTGKRRPTLRDRISAFLPPLFQPRTVYVFAMAVFSFSVVINAAGINLRNLRLRDLNPRNWVYQIERNGYLLYGRAEKYCYDLRVVYEIESRLRQLRTQPGEGQPAVRPQAPPGGSTHDRPPSDLQLALAGALPSGREDAWPFHASMAVTPRIRPRRSVPR